MQNRLKFQLSDIIESIKFRENINRLGLDKVALVVDGKTIYSPQAAQRWQNESPFGTYDYVRSLYGDWIYRKKNKDSRGNVSIEENFFYGCEQVPVKKIPNNIVRISWFDIEKDIDFRTMVLNAGGCVDLYDGDRLIDLDVYIDDTQQFTYRDIITYGSDIFWFVKNNPDDFKLANNQ